MVIRHINVDLFYTHRGYEIEFPNRDEAETFVERTGIGKYVYETAIDGHFVEIDRSS